MNQGRIDVAELWRRSFVSPLATVNGHIEVEVEVINISVTKIRGLLACIGKVEASLEYLYKVSHGGLLKCLFYRLDTFDWGRSVEFTWPNAFIRKARRDASKLYDELMDVRRKMILSLGKYILSKGLVSIVDEPDNQGEHNLVGPTWITRYLVPGLGYAGLVLILGRIVVRIDWEGAYRNAIDVLTASQNLLQDWVFEPIRDIWRIIRYRSSNLALVSATALRADMESLERMVVAFAIKRYPEIPTETVLEQVRQGDATLLLRCYERELQSPLRNALIGKRP